MSKPTLVIERKAKVSLFEMTRFSKRITDICTRMGPYYQRPMVKKFISLYIKTTDLFLTWVNCKGQQITISALLLYQSSEHVLRDPGWAGTPQILCWLSLRSLRRRQKVFSWVKFDEISRCDNAINCTRCSMLIKVGLRDTSVGGYAGIFAFELVWEWAP